MGVTEPMAMMQFDAFSPIGKEGEIKEKELHSWVIDDDMRARAPLFPLCPHSQASISVLPSIVGTQQASSIPFLVQTRCRHLLDAGKGLVCKAASTCKSS